MYVFKHTVVRLYLYLLFFLFAITAGLAMFVLAPLYKRAFAPQLSLRKLSLTGIWRHAYRVMWRTATDKKYRNMYPTKLGDPPKLHTDLSLVRVRNDWPGEAGDCDICEAACCVRLKCPLLGENGRCMSFNSIFFNYFFCGRYPENQSQIDYYDCPKWELNDGK